MRDAFAQVNASLCAMNDGRPADERIGTTLLIAHFLERGLVVGSVGGAQGYMLRKRELQQLTGRPARAEAEPVARQTSAHEILPAVGLSRSVEPSTRYHDLQVGDLILLCSIGVTVALPDEFIAEILSSSGPVRDLCDAIVRAANAAWGRDNISAAVVRLGRAPTCG